MSGKGASPAEVLQVLEGMRDSWGSGEVSTVGTTIRATFESALEPSRTAVVATPGDTWFAVALDDGFGWLILWDEPDIDRVRTILSELMDVTTSYLTNGGELVTEGRCFPMLVVSGKARDYEMIRSFDDEIRRMWRRMVQRLKGLPWNG